MLVLFQEQGPSRTYLIVSVSHADAYCTVFFVTMLASPCGYISASCQPRKPAEMSHSGGGGTTAVAYTTTHLACVPPSCRTKSAILKFKSSMFFIRRCFCRGARALPFEAFVSNSCAVVASQDEINARSNEGEGAGLDALELEEHAAPSTQAPSAKK